MIHREDFDWGVRLTVRPFSSGSHQAHTIQVEIGSYRRNRGSETRIIFPAVVAANPLRLGDAQAWQEAFQALLAEVRSVIVQMKSAAH